MKTTVIEQKKEENDIEISKFRRSPALARTSFINGIIVISITAIYVVIEAIIQRGLIASYVIYSLILALALIGTILGGISFREGKNVYGIIGFILNLILVASIPWVLHALSRIPF